jgi:DNA-binding PadR family transcriptional regulator
MRRLKMSISSRTPLEVAILHLLENGPAGNLPEIVRQLRSLADDASIKAALLRLNSEGLVEITAEWTFRATAAAAAS